jgi:hypothetical protein
MTTTGCVLSVAETLVRSGVRNGRGRPWKDRTHCEKGHEYTEANTLRRPDNGSRRCRTCARERDNAWYARRGAAARKARRQGKTP